MKAIWILASMLVLPSAVAAAPDCWKNSERVQSVFVHLGATEVAHWQDTQVHRVRVPSGKEFGFRIEPATPENYRELLGRVERAGITAMPEVVKISLYDVATDPPTL